MQKEAAYRQAAQTAAKSAAVRIRNRCHEGSLARVRGLLRAGPHGFREMALNG